jgi:hypothetical protein
MAEVWLGRNLHLGSAAAIKFLNRSYAGVPPKSSRLRLRGSDAVTQKSANLSVKLSWIRLAFWVSAWVGGIGILKGAPLIYSEHRSPPVRSTQKNLRPKLRRLLRRQLPRPPDSFPDTRTRAARPKLPIPRSRFIRRSVVPVVPALRPYMIAYEAVDKHHA